MFLALFTRMGEGLHFFIKLNIICYADKWLEIKVNINYKRIKILFID